MFSRCQCYFEACGAKFTGRTERLHCSLTKEKKKKQRACIVLATNMNFMFLPKLSFPAVGTPGSKHLLVIQTNTSMLHPAQQFPRNSYLNIFQEQQ